MTTHSLFDGVSRFALSAQILRSPPDAPSASGGGGGGGDGAPAGSGIESSPSPAVDAPSSPASGGGDSAPAGGDAFEIPDDLDDDFVDPLSGGPQSGPAGEEPGQPQPVAQPAQPAAAPVAQPSQVQQPPAPAVAGQQPVVAQPPGEAAQPASTSGEPAAPKSFVEIVEGSRDVLVKDLASQPRFQLSEAEVTALDGGDMSVISNFGARVFVESIVTQAKLLEQALPNMVAAAIIGQQAQTEADNAFYSQYKSLGRPEFRKTIFQLGSALRQMNPTMSREEFMPKLAASAAAFLGVALDSSPAAPGQSQVQRSPVPNGHSPVISAVPMGQPQRRAAPTGEDWSAVFDAIGQLEEQ